MIKNTRMDYDGYGFCVYFNDGQGWHFAGRKTDKISAQQLIDSIWDHNYQEAV